MLFEGYYGGTHGVEMDGAAHGVLQGTRGFYVVLAGVLAGYRRRSRGVNKYSLGTTVYQGGTGGCLGEHRGSGTRLVPGVLAGYYKGS